MRIKLLARQCWLCFFCFLSVCGQVHPHSNCCSKGMPLCAPACSVTASCDVGPSSFSLTCSLLLEVLEFVFGHCADSSVWMYVTGLCCHGRQAGGHFSTRLFELHMQWEGVLKLSLKAQRNLACITSLWMKSVFILFLVSFLFLSLSLTPTPLLR